MAFELVADVGLIAVATLLALLCFGVGYLIKAIADTLGTIPLIFGLSIPLGKIFQSITYPVANWLIGAGASLFKYAENWLRGLGYIFIQLFFGTVQTQATHATQIEHLHNVTIPDTGRAAVATAHEYTATQLQAVRLQIHAAQAKWEEHHSSNDALAYIAAERLHPSVENAQLAMHARTLLATEAHAQDLHNQLYDYIGKHVTGQADVALPYTGQTLTGVAGAIAIPRGTAVPNLDVQDVIRVGSQVAIGTAVAIIATKIVDCLVSNCEGNNNFSNLLKAALGFTDFALVASFLEQVVSNPAVAAATAAGDIEAIVRPLVAGGGDVVSELELLFSI